MLFEKGTVKVIELIPREMRQTIEKEIARTKSMKAVTGLYKQEQLCDGSPTWGMLHSACIVIKPPKQIKNQIFLSSLKKQPPQNRS